MKHIVLIDNYDSFTYNLVDYFQQFGARVSVCTNRTSISTIKKLDPDLLVFSPGPGNPTQAGNLIKYIQTFATTIPQFGVCLGMQAMLVAFGGSLRVLPQPKHGKASLITHEKKGLFKSLPNPLAVGRYHSLAAASVPVQFKVTATTEDNIVMAIQHIQLPIAGVQFHPESILTKPQYGLRLLRNVLEQL